MQIERHIGWAERYKGEKRWHEDKEAEIRKEIEKCRGLLEKEVRYVEELKSVAQKGIGELLKCVIEIT